MRSFYWIVHTKKLTVSTLCAAVGLLVLLVGRPTTTDAQVRIDKKTFSLGFNIAQTTAPLSALGEEQLKPVVTVGYGADLRLLDNAHLHFGLRYGPRGNKYRIDYTDSTYLKTDLKLRYLDLPLSLVLTAGRPGARIKPYLAAGVYGGVGVSGKEVRNGKIVGAKTKLADSTYTQETKVFGQTIRRFDAGYQLEAGIQARMVQLGVQYGESFNDLRLNRGDAIRNRTWGVFLKVLFDDIF